MVGTLVNAKGEDVSAAKLKELVSGPMGQQAWAKVEASHWVRDGKAARSALKLGYDEAGWVEVREGLQAGDAVVVAGKAALREGSAVQVLGQGKDKAKAGPAATQAATR